MIPDYDDATKEQRDEVFRRARERHEQYEREVRARTPEEWKAILEAEEAEIRRLRGRNEEQAKWIGFLCIILGVAFLGQFFPNFVHEWLRCSGVDYFTCGR